MSKKQDVFNLMQKGNLNDGSLQSELEINEVKEIAIDDIIEIENIRTEYDQESLNELADSIKKNGLLNPITVCKNKNKYQVIAGHRRLRACQIAGLNKLYCNVLFDVNILVLQLVENIQRDDLTDIEKENAIYKLNESGMSQKKLPI